MRYPRKIRHEFVEFIPKDRVDGVIYISIPYATAVHNCFCGCGLKVVTPINPVGWQLIYDGDSISLWPSVGNWSFPCRSHYWVRSNQVIPAGPMSQAEIDLGRQRDSEARDEYFFGNITVRELEPTPVKKRNFWEWLISRK